MSDTTRLGITITAQDTNATASIKQLQSAARGLQETLNAVTGSAADSSGKLTNALQSEINAINNEIAARQRQITSIKAVTAAIKEQGEAAAVTYRTLQENIDASFGSNADRAIKSASESARILATSLSAAAEADARLRDQAMLTTEALERQGAAVRTLSGEQFFGVFNRQQGLGQQRLSAAESAAAFQSQLGEPGTAIEGIKAAGFSTIVADLAGVKQSLLSAAESAKVFEAELGAIGGSITGTATAGFHRMVSDLAGVKTSYLSAAESARVFETELGAIGGAVTTTASSGFHTLVGDLAGVKQTYLSAAESAKVFEQSLGEIGTATTTIASSGFSRLVSDLLDVKTTFLSAKESAAVFVRELGEVGTGITTIASAGFHQMVADLADVKMSYLSAAESAEVFARAGLTATERNLGMTEKSVEAAARAERAQRIASSGGGRGSTGSASLEMRHVVAGFDELARGQRGALFGTIGAAARDAGLGITAMATSVAGLVAIMGAGAILHHAVSLGEWATKTRAAASAAGMGIQQYSALQGALSLVGVKAESADATLRRLAVNLNTALADPASKTAEAFHNLGISQEELTKNGADVNGAINLLADAFQRTQDGANKTAALSQILGRGFESLIPALQGGKTELQQLEEKAKSLGLTLTEDTATKLEKTGQEVKTLGETIKGDAIKAFEAWSPVIQGVTVVLGGLLDVLLKIGGAVGIVVSAVFTAGQSMNELTASQGYITDPVTGVRIYGPKPTPANENKPGESGGNSGKVPVPPLTTPSTPLEVMRRDMAQAALAASQGPKTRAAALEAESKAEIAVMQQTLATAKLTEAQRTQIQSELAQKQISLNNELLSSGAQAAKQSYADFAAAEKLKITSAESSVAQVVAVYDEWLKAAEGRYKQSAAVIVNIEREKVQAINAARLREIKESTQEVEQQNKLGKLNLDLANAQRAAFNPQAGIQKTDPATYQQQASQAVAQAAQIKANADQQISALKEIAATATEGSATQKEALQQINQITISSKTQEIALYKQAASATAAASAQLIKPFATLTDGITNQFQQLSVSIFNALILPQRELIKQGLTTIRFSQQGNEIRSAFRKVFLGVADDFSKSVEEAIGRTIAQTVSKGAANSISQLLSQSLSNVVGSVFGNTAGNALSSAAGNAIGGAAGNAVAITTPITTAVTATGTGIVGAITASSGAIVGAITAQGAAEDALLVGLNVKPSVAGFSYSQGGIVPSAAGGMIVGSNGSVGGNGGSLSILHSQEMVLPAHLSRGIQGIINSGQTGGARSNSTLNYAPTINSNGGRSRSGTGMTRAEFQQTMAQHSGAMFGEARNMMRSGWRPG